jgi:hypothetical protein
MVRSGLVVDDLKFQTQSNDKTLRPCGLYDGKIIAIRELPTTLQKSYKVSMEFESLTLVL